MYDDKPLDSQYPEATVHNWLKQGHETFKLDLSAYIIKAYTVLTPMHLHDKFQIITLALITTRECVAAKPTGALRIEELRTPH